MKQKSAIIPYRYTNGNLEILLIKNTDNTKWVIPKGSIEKPLKPVVSATKEAYEEAGVLGIPYPILVGTYHKNDQDVPTYLLRVIVELSNYEEDDIRDRAWHKIDDVNEYIVDDDLLNLIKLGSKIINKNSYYFKYAVRSFCDDINVEPLKIGKKKAIISCPHKGYDNFKVKIRRRRTFLNFSLESKYVFKTLDEIPNELMTKLLLDNTVRQMGYWSLKKIDIGYLFMRMFNEELHVLNSESLLSILNLMITNYKSLEGLIDNSISVKKLMDNPSELL